MKREDLQEILDLLNAIQTMPKESSETSIDGVYAVRLNATTIVDLAEKVKAALVEADEPEFDGVAVRVGRTVYSVPAMNIRRLKKMLPEINNLTLAAGTLTNEDQDRLVRIIHSALSRNYPKLTKDDVEDIVDMGNFRTFLQAIMGVSGLKQYAPGEKLAEE